MVKFFIFSLETRNPMVFNFHWLIFLDQINQITYYLSCVI